MELLAPLESLKFFENHCPEFISNDKDIEEIVKKVESALQAPKSESFHANVLEQGKSLIKYVLTKSIEYLSDESNSAKYRSIDNLNKYTQVSHPQIALRSQRK